MDDGTEYLRYMSGKANFLGFKIQDVWGSEVESKHYRKGAVINLCFEWFLIILVGGGSVYLFLTGTINPLLLAISMLLVNFCTYLRLFRRIILEIILYLPYFGHNAKEWHAIEHKTAYIIATSGRNGLTLENMRNAPSIAPRCGFGNHAIKEPSDDKIREALKVAKQYLKVPE